MKTFSKTPSGSEALSRIKCPFCGCDVFRFFLNCGTHKYVKCRKCGLVMQNPQPEQDDLLKRYDNDYFSYEIENEDNFLNLMLLTLRDFHFDKIEEKLSDKSFLDIGCATGRLLKEMKTRGWRRVQGIEVCEASARYGREHNLVPVFCGTLEQSNLRPESFTFVHSSHVIEHLNEPVEFVGRISGLLKKGGYFLCVTPALDSFQARLFREKWRSAIADHLFLFTKRSLKKIMKRYNLKIMRIQTWGGLGTGLGNPAIKKVLDYSAKKFGFGDVMAILAQKT